MTWRDHIKVHPAADLFPMMSESELLELGEDIKKNGQKVQIIFFSEDGPTRPAVLIDGRNRLDAMELVGLPIHDEDGHPAFSLRFMDGDPYDLVLSLNINRRHLTSEQKRELIDKVLKAKPEQSDAAIAKQTKTSDKTVAKRRRKLESTSEIPRLEKTVGKDGKKRGRPPMRKAGPPRHPQPDAAAPRVAGSEEVDIEQRRAEYAALDPEPDRPVVTELDGRIIRAASAIRYEAMGLTHSDAERFFAAIRDQIDSIERQVLQDAEAAPSDYAALPDLSIPDFLRRSA